MSATHHTSAGSSLNILNKMTLSQKLSLVLMALLIPIAVLMFMLVVESAEKTAFAEQELKGVEYIVPLKQLQQHLAEHRGMTSALLSGSQNMAIPAKNKRAAVATDFVMLGAVDMRLGQELGSTQSLQLIKKKWDQLVTRIHSLDAATAVLLHSDLIAKVKKLTTDIGDRSNLTLDPEVDSHYLADLMVSKIPRIVESGGILRAVSSGIAARQVISQEERSRLISLIVMLRSLGNDAEKGINVISKFNVQNSPGQSAGATEADAVASIYRFTELVEKELIYAEQITMTADKVYTEATASLQGMFDLYDAAGPLLTSLLNQRIDNANKHTLANIAVSVVFIVLALMLAFFIMRSITWPLARTIQVFTEISRGNYENTLVIQGRDEVSKVQLALVDMQQQLTKSRAEEQEIAVVAARIQSALVHVTTHVTVSDSNNKLIFINDSCRRLLGDLSTKSGHHSSTFNVDTLMGTSLADFFPGESLRNIYRSQLQQTQEASFAAWGRSFKLIISPVFDDNQNYQGRITQWIEVTEELLAEQEIGQIVMAANAGDLSKRILADNKQGFFKDLASGINELIEGVDSVIGDIASAMGNVAKGDLTQPISQQYTGTYDAVKQSVNGTIQNLEGIVARLQQLSVEISDSAGEISSQNQELSQRTSQQASDLETTAASMEEINGTVAQNADNAREATEVSANARKISEKGVKIVQRTIDAMESISQSSSKIEEITAVIDEIAFQTNLLALNAAVEAAHAGDQGKGFAVVATEVRELASRSSDAAKEIKTLIEGSVSEIRGGMVLANEAGTTLDEVAQSIGNVSNIIDEIATSNQEQSLGINQINLAVTKIDQSTQENTVLAGRTAEIALALREQAGDLDNMIQGFTLSSSQGRRTQPGFLKAVNS